MRRVGSGTRKGEKLMKGVLMSRLLLWASGLSSAGHLLRDSVTWAKKFPPEGQELPPSLDENGPGGVVSLTVPVCLQVLSYCRGKECLYVGRSRVEERGGRGDMVLARTACYSVWQLCKLLEGRVWTALTFIHPKYPTRSLVPGRCLLTVNKRG